LILYFVVGVFVYRDYGISFDETTSRENGRINVVYVGQKLGFGKEELTEHFGSVQDLEEWKDKDYGVLFEVTLVLAEAGLGLTDDTDIYRLRHLVSFAVFTLGLFVFFLCARQTLENPWLAVLGMVMLATTPKMFAHAFYNSKDIPLMVACILAAFTLLRFLRRPTLHLAVVHALACAMVICLRIVGVYLVAATCAMAILPIFHETARVRRLGTLGVFLVSVTGFVYILWPYLWTAPIDNFLAAFEAMSQFRWFRSNLFQGEFIEASKLPWTYAPVWIAITIPPLYSALFVLGAGLALADLFRIRRFLRLSPAEREPTLILGLFLVPVLAVIALRSLLYDSWRHLFFVYPFLLLTALHGARWLLQYPAPAYRTVTRIAVGVASGVTILLMTAFLIRSHPHQSVYFNFLAGAHPEDRYQMDCWGTSFFQGLQFLVDHQPKGEIRVAVNQSIGKRNQMMFRKPVRTRLNFVKLSRADYFISNFRGPNAYQAVRDGQPPYDNPLKLFQVDGSSILGVYRVER
jgi:hypothetical protein